MKSRTSRTSRFQIEKLEERDIPSRLIGLLAVPVEGPSFDRSGYQVQAVSQPSGIKWGDVAPKAVGADIIAILR